MKALRIAVCDDEQAECELLEKYRKKTMLLNGLCRVQVISIFLISALIFDRFILYDLLPYSHSCSVS